MTIFVLMDFPKQDVNPYSPEHRAAVDSIVERLIEMGCLNSPILDSGGIYCDGHIYTVGLQDGTRIRLSFISVDDETRGHLDDDRIREICSRLNAERNPPPVSQEALLEKQHKRPSFWQRLLLFFGIRKGH